ncbi:hypothetical protein OH76DRAFT_1487356 [Lentinus brumalis]|uniref:F-box domain-containing protein n=1 Tax=Lentinus brumalis TaxID=2498619 RepID=A0A371CV48_9APHY|nr:hypothetical protein OH76DRAFT_1487356 [Polyporus brumalis]
MPAAREGPTTRDELLDTIAATLDLDTLQIIFSFLPRADLLSVSCASRFVREWAIKELLRRPVSLKYPSTLESWCRFVLAGKDRPAYVRDLSIYLEVYGSISKKRGKLLLRFLQRATRLQRLFLGEAILNADPGISAAISHVPALESFEMQFFYGDANAQETVSGILAAMKSPLKFLSLHVAFHCMRNGTELELWNYDIPGILSPHQEHLEVLHLGSPDERILAVCYPNLRKLQIPMTESQPRPASLFGAFPNLRHLCLRPDPLGDNHFREVPADRYPALRHSRVSEQSGGRVWALLDTLRGQLMQLYVFGLTCPVRRLEIERYLASKHDAAVEVVQCACPKKLVLGLNCWTSVSAMISEPSLIVPASPDRPHVTHLTIKILRSSPAPSTPDLLHDLVLLLQNSKVEYLRLAIGGAYMSEEDLEDYWTVDECPREGVRDLDLQLLRDGLVGAATALRVLVFTVRNRGETVWAVDRSSPLAVTTTVTEVDPVVARELIRREEE